MDRITADTFKPLLHSRFQVGFHKDQHTDVVLVEINTQDSDSGYMFSLLFRAPADRINPQGIYPVRHEEMDDMNIFLVPLGPDREGFCYEAVFNYRD